MPPKTPIYRIITKSRVYPNAGPPKDPGEDIFSNFVIQYGDIERFEVLYPIGSGKYSVVFLGRADGKRACAIKALKNVPFSKIQREICLLNLVSKVPGVVQVLGVVRDPLTQIVSLITEYQSFESPKVFYPKLDLNDIRVLMYQILNCLNECHKLGVMHRDIKPGNIIIGPDKLKATLIDFGLADLYYPETAYTTRVSTLRYKAPELLLNYQYYDYGIDIWGAGCVLA